MAKKRRVAKDRTTIGSAGGQPLSAGPATSSSAFAPGQLLGSQTVMLLATAMLSAILVYVTYHPSDSVAVERGDALWLGLFALVTTTIGLAGWCMRSKAPFASRSEWLIDLVAWTLAGWVMLAAISTSPPGNLRLATNEAWLWITGAALFSCARRLLTSLSARRAVMTLAVACACGLAAHGMHQEWIALPKMRADFQADPDAMLKEIQMVAPPGSSERMVFENRLMDGGPSGTFALANSLAGVLLIGCVIAVGVILSLWSASASWQKAAWLFALAVMLACLWAARSRSATAACLVSIVATALGVIALRSGDSAADASSAAGARFGRAHLAKLGLLGASGLTVLGAAVLTLIATVGKREWMEQAPASIMVRLQYWRSTWNMVLDRPLFGCGPGNFQSIYQRYRELSTSEQIADPHNWFFETFACGGFVGAGLLIALGVLSVRFVYRQRLLAPANDLETENVDTAKWCFAGAGFALMAVWLLAFVTRSLGDSDGQVFAVPVSLVTGAAFWVSAKQLSSRSLDMIAATAFAALMIHLLAAGGWTIPGVAIYIWLISGMLTRVDIAATNQAGASTPTKRNVMVVLATGLLLACALQWVSLSPVTAKDAAMRDAEYSRSLDQFRAADAAMVRAVEADDWAFEPSLFRSDGLHWEVIYLDRFSEASELTKKWQAELDRALLRASENPSIQRAAGLQYLHVYQRWGQPAHLGHALKLLEKAAVGSPADQWIAAQLAAIAKAKGDQKEHRKWLETAKKLAGLTANPERDLSRQMIYLADHMQRRAESGPVLFKASDLVE